MESLKTFALLCLAAVSAYGGVKTAGRLYYQGFMGHLHQEASDSGASLTAVQCAHPVQLIEKEGIDVPAGWVYAKVGEDKGFMRRERLSAKRPDCFQHKYPKFYGRLELDLSDYYYWGRLSDHYIEGESVPR